MLFGHQLTVDQAALDDVRNWLTPAVRADTPAHGRVPRSGPPNPESYVSTVLGDGEGQLCSTGHGHDPAIAGF